MMTTTGIVTIAVSITRTATTTVITVMTAITRTIATLGITLMTAIAVTSLTVVAVVTTVQSLLLDQLRNHLQRLKPFPFPLLTRNRRLAYSLASVSQLKIKQPPKSES